MTLPSIHVSPAEHPPVLRALGASSPLPERYGCDFLWRARGHWFGLQRKELHDFIASYSDGRLARELAQMRAHVELPLVVIEGQPRFTNDGTLMLRGESFRSRDPWTFSSLFNAVMSVRHESAHVMLTDGVKETAHLVELYAEWSTKEHLSLQTRGAPTAEDPWGRLTNADHAKWFLQGLPNCGPKLAGAIFTHFGRVPFRWDVDEKALMEVRGVGRELARRWTRLFQSGDAVVK